MLPKSAKVLPTSSRGCQHHPTVEDAWACCKAYSHEIDSACLNDPEIKPYFESFRLKCMSTYTALLWLSCSVILSFTSFIGLYVVNTEYEANLIPVQIALSARALFGIISLVLVWKTFKPVDNDNLATHASCITKLSDILVIGYPVANAIMLCWLSAQGSCDDSEGKTLLFDCNDAYEYGGLPQTATLRLLFSNIFVVVILKCHREWAAIGGCILSLLATIIAASFSPNPSSSAIVVFLSLMMIVVCREMERSSFALFQTLLRLEMTKRIQSSEMKCFIGNVAHDLKTPLHGFSLTVSALLEDAQSKLLEANIRDHFVDALGMCKNDCTFMSIAINRTVDFSKSTSNIVLQPHVESTCLQDCIQWAVRCVQCTQNRIPIVVLPHPSTISNWLLTDKHWLMENILCYLSNAVKFSSRGKVTVQLSLSHTASEKCPEAVDLESNSAGGNAEVQLRIDVEDEGIGVSEEDKAELFQPFQQAMRLVGGTGLGLYSLSKRVEALGGEFGVESRRDRKQGSRFWFSIPYLPDAAASPEPSVTSSLRRTLSWSDVDGDGDTERASRPRALVVDDSAVVAKATSRMLCKVGFRVDSAENGASGLEKMKQRRYDLVLMDLQMPVMDGLEATRRYRAFEKRFEFEASKKSPKVQKTGDTGDSVMHVCSNCHDGATASSNLLFIVGMSANGADDVRKDAMKSGMCEFYAKPFSSSDFQKLSFVQRLVNNAQATEDTKSSQYAFDAISENKESIDAFS